MSTINYSLADLQALSPTITERFWKLVNKNGPVPQHCPELGPCWLWLGCTNDKGYGQLFVVKNRPPHQRLIYAHRLSWIIHFGIVPDGQWILHKCDNASCVNPSHFFPGTVQDNSRDMALKGRSGVIKHGLDIVAAIRSHPEMSCRALSDMYQVSTSQVWNIRNFKHRPSEGITPRQPNT